MPRRPFIPRLVLTLLIASTLAAGGPVAAQPSPLLDGRPITAESLGLTVHPPAGALTQMQRTGEIVSITLVDASEVPAWTMRILTRTMSRPEATPAAEIEGLLESWRSAGRTPTIISNEPVTYAGRRGQLCYVRQEAPGGEAVVVGWLMLPLAKRELLVFSLQMLPEDLPRVRALFEAVFSSIRLRDVTEIAGERRTRLERGEAFLATLTPDRLRSLVGLEEWARYYRPAVEPGAADTEIGWVHVEVLESKRGVLNPGREESRYDPGEHERGLLVRVHGRVIESSASGLYYDSEALFWVAWDQSTEAWSVRGTHRQRSAARSEAETGVRTPKTTGDPAGSLTVITSGLDGAARTPRTWRVPDIYLSQAIRWNLGRLLATEPSPSPRSLSWYFYDSGSTSITLRIDEWTRAGDGQWTLRSRARSDDAAIVSVHDAGGRLIRRTWPDGSVSVPITGEALQALWQRKGLGLGSAQ